MFSFPFLAHSVTPLELKTMQTRKFNKHSIEIFRAIKSYCEDAGAMSVVPDGVTRLSPAEMNRPDANPTGIKVTGATCMFAPKMKIGFLGSIKDENKYARIKAELLKSTESESVIRIRLYAGLPPEQLIKPEAYSEIFKAVGDALFVQAVVLEAAEQD